MRNTIGRVREMLIFTYPYKFSGDNVRARKETAIETNVVGKQILNRYG